MKRTHACNNIIVGKYSRVVLCLWSPYKVLPELPPIVWYLVVEGFSDFVHVASAGRGWVVAAHDERVREVEKLLAAAMLT
jgi:hypothetical protein